MDVQELRRLVTHMEAQRDTRLPVWRLLAQYILPHRGCFPEDTRENATGKTRGPNLVNATAARSLKRAASGLTSGMTPAGLEWFKHEFADRAVREAEGARDYADRLDELLRDVLKSGGFYPAIHAFNTEYLGFGCALLYEESDVATAARFQCVTCGSYAVGLDQHGMLDAVCRRVQYTAREAVRLFGEEQMSRGAVLKSQREPYSTVEVMQVVMRREERKAGAMDARNLPFASYWYEIQADAGAGLLRESGYHEMPFFFARYEDALGVYGTGPGDDALGDARQVDALERRKIVGLDTALRPPMLKPSTYKSRLVTTPGGETAVSEQENSRVRMLYESSPAQVLPLVQEELRTVAQRVDDTLLATVFADMPLEMRPAGISATEWAGRRNERLSLMGPNLAAYEPTVLAKVLERTYGLLDRAGLTPVPPRAIGPVAYLNVTYLSPITQALQARKGEAVMAAVSDILPLAQADSGILDKIDFDQIADEVVRSNGAPGSIVRSDEAVAQMRQTRAEAQAQQEQEQRQQMAAQQMMQAASVPAGPDSMVGKLLNSGRGA